jgi:hypothetical protein
MFNPAVKKIIPGAGVAVLACVAIALFVTWSAQNESSPARPNRAVAACVRAWTSDDAHVKVTAAYPGTATSLLTWIHESFPIESTTIRTVENERNDPVVECYLAGSFGGIPLAPGAATYTNIVVSRDERTGVETLLVAGHSSRWSFHPPS